MTSAFLDTNACIALINGSPPAVRARFEEAVISGRRLSISSVVVFELEYGAAKSDRRALNQRRVANFLAGPLETIAFDDRDARVAGDLRATLERRGTPIGAYDRFIGAQALRAAASLVTANAREFRRISGLDVVDWSSTTT